LSHRLNVHAFAIQIEDIAAEDRIVAHNGRRGDELGQSLSVRLAIVVHEPKMGAGQRQRGPHADVKAACAAGVLLRANHAKGCISTGFFRGEQIASRLIRSIVDDQKVFGGKSLGVDRGETPLEQLGAVPRYDDCSDS
jgi:hypothetical protein